jgi:hypothetical protein
LSRRRSCSEPDAETPGLRRNVGGSRHEATERITLRAGDFVVSGWTLNLSRGGVRIVLEDPVELGAEYTVTIGPADDERAKVHQGRVVWLQDEADGQIAGIQFLDQAGDAPGPGDPRSG